jgi:hypothetical protein
LRQEVRTSLGTNYLDLGKDPWDAQYQFWAGPWNSSVKQGQRYRLNQGWNGTTTIPFRIYMPGRELEDGTYQPYVYNQAAKNQADMDLPGNPDPDGAFGFPANDDLEIYVWSMGEDAISNQNFRDPDNYNGYPNDMDPEKLGGGDDIGSWDKTGGFEVWYN